MNTCHFAMQHSFSLSHTHTHALSHSLAISGWAKFKCTGEQKERMSEVKSELAGANFETRMETNFFDDVNVNVNVDVDDDDCDDVLFVLLSLLVSFVPANEER